MNDQYIINEYTINGRSTYDIAEQLGTYANKIKRILLKYGVKLRTKSDAQKLALKNKRAHSPMTGEHHSEESRQKISDTLRFKVHVTKDE